MVTKKEAKYYRDKHVVDVLGGVEKFKRLDEPDRLSTNVEEENLERMEEEKLFAKPNNFLIEVYNDIKEVLKYYIEMSEENYHIISLWIIGSYLHESFEAFPYLFINAMRGSAKTRTLRLISHMAYKGNGNVETGINETTLYRTEKGATLVLDELEAIGGKDKAEFRQYLNASYKKGITVSRAKKVKSKDGEDYVVVKYEPYRPVAMANIWGMEEVLGDRCISIIIEKSSNRNYTKVIENFSENAKLLHIKKILCENQCSLCSVVTKKNIVQKWNNFVKETTLTTLTTTTTQTTLTTLQHNNRHYNLFNKIDKTEIDGRNLELFLPLFLIAEMLGEDVLDNTLEIASKLVSSKKEDELSESRDVSLYSFIASLNVSVYDYTNVSTLTKRFKEYLGDVDDVEDKWLNSKWLGRALKRLNLILSKKRVARGVEITLNVPKAQDKLKMFGKKKDD